MHEEFKHFQQADFNSTAIVQQISVGTSQQTIYPQRENTAYCRWLLGMNISMYA